MLLQCCPQRSRWQGFCTALCSVEIFGSCFITGQTTHAVSEEAQCRHRMSHCKPSTIKVAKLSAHVRAQCKYSTIDSSPGARHWHVFPTTPVNKDNAGCHMRSRKNTAQHAAHATIPCSSSVALNDQGGKVSARSVLGRNIQQLFHHRANDTRRLRRSPVQTPNESL